MFGTTILDRTLTATSVENIITFGLPTLDRTLTTTSVENIITFGSPTLDRTLTATSVTSTSVISNEVSIAYVIDPISIINTSTFGLPILDRTLTTNSANSTLVFGTSGLFQLGNGTITNFFVNTIQDLSTEQIAKYSNISINSVPGNKIFDGFGTIFTTQLTVGNQIIVIDINDTNEEFTLTIDSISGNNALSVTANVLYSNSSFAIVNNAIYLYS